MKLVRGVVSRHIPYLIVDETELNFANGAPGNDTFNITSNGAWTVTDNQSWCSESPDSGSNNLQITVSVTSGTDRYALITIEGQGITRYITVNQGTPP